MASIVHQALYCWFGVGLGDTLLRGLLLSPLSLDSLNLPPGNMAGLKHRSLIAGHCFTFWKVTKTLSLANPKPKVDF